MATTIDQLAAKNQANNDAAGKALDNFAAGIQTVTTRMKETAQEVADAQMAATTATGLAVQKAQKANFDAATTLGTNPEAPTYMLNKIAEQYNKSNARAQQYADDVAYAADPSNIVDDPLKYIKNVLLMSMNEKGQESAERSALRAAAQYKGLNDMTQESAQTQAALMQTETAAKIKADSLVAAYTFTQGANQAELESMRLGSDSVMKALQLSNSDFDIERARQSAADDAVRLGLARQQAARANLESDVRLERERRANAREKRQVEAEDRAIKAEANILGVINTTAEALGAKLKFSSIEELELARKIPRLKDTVDMLYEAGVVSAMASGKNPDGSVKRVISLTDSPAQALKFVKASGAPLSPGQDPLIKFFDAENANLQKNNPEVLKMKPAEFAAELDKQIRTKAGEYYKDITKGERNIYSAPPLSVYLGNAEFVQGAPLLSAAMKTYSELGDKSVDFGKLTNTLVDAAARGTVKLDRVDSELKFLAHKTMAINNGLRRYNETAGLDNMTNVNVQLPVKNNTPGGDPVGSAMLAGIDFVASGFQAPKDPVVSVDLADDNKRAAYLNKRYASEIPLNIRQQAAKKGTQK